jgi:hypothetical protein
VAGSGPAAETKGVQDLFAKVTLEGDSKMLRKNPRPKARKETAKSSKKPRQRAKRRARISKNAVIHQGIDSFEPYADI